MIDPRLVLLLAAIYGAVWGVGQAVKGVKWVAHKVHAGVEHVVHPHREVKK